MNHFAKAHTAAGEPPWWSRTIDRQLKAALSACQARTEAVHPAAVRLSAVPLSGDFNKLRTNMLIHRATEQVRAYVDHDLQYQGEDETLKRILNGQRQKSWKQLTTNLPATDAGQAIKALLALFKSPVIGVLNIDLSESSQRERERLEPSSILATQTRAMEPTELSHSFRKSLHKPLARQIAVALTRQPPQGGLVWGPAGAGKEQLACSAAHVLLQRGSVRTVRYLHAARLTCGRHFPAERDAVLSALLGELV